MEYLSNHSLFVDVWDADSLLLIGTCSLPLRRIMRQGQKMVRCAVECDVIDSEDGRSVGGGAGVATQVIREDGILSGTVVGAINVILSNVGGQGKNPLRHANTNHNNSNNNNSRPFIEGMNWRAHLDRSGSASISAKRHPARPKISVRARCCS